MRPASLLLIPLGIMAAAPPDAPAQAPQSAAAATARGGRTLERGLDSVLGGQGAGAPEERTLFLLIDATPSLRQAGFVDKLALALARNKARLSQTHIGVALVGAKTSITLQPTQDRKLVIEEVRRLLSKSTKVFQNVYAAVRVAAARMRAWSSSKRPSQCSPPPFCMRMV